MKKIYWIDRKLFFWIVAGVLCVSFLTWQLCKSVKQVSELQNEVTRLEYNSRTYQRAIQHLQDLHKLGYVVIDDKDGTIIYEYTADNSGLFEKE